MLPYTQIDQIMPDLSGYFTPQAAAQRLDYSVEHVRRMLREGDLEGLKIGYMWLVSKESVEKYLKETSGMGKFDRRRGNI